MPEPRIKVRFRVLYRPTCQGEQPGVIGSIPDLGNWRLDRGNNLHQRARCLPVVSGSQEGLDCSKIWETVMAVPSNTEFEWNWVILNLNDKIIKRESNIRTLKVDSHSLNLHSQWDDSCQMVKKNICRIDLRTTYLTRPEEILGICGSAPTLGKWDPEFCVHMDRCFPRDSGKWRASFKISNEIETEWKLVVVHKATKELIRWEERSNRSLLTCSQWVKLEANWSGSDIVMDTMSLDYDEHFNTMKLLNKQRASHTQDVEARHTTTSILSELELIQPSVSDASGASWDSTAPLHLSVQNSDNPEPAEASPSSCNPVSLDTGNINSAEPVRYSNTDIMKEDSSGVGSASGCSETTVACMLDSLEKDDMTSLASGGVVDGLHKGVSVEQSNMLAKENVSEIKLVNESFLMDRTHELESLDSMVEYEARLDNILGLEVDSADTSPVQIRKYLQKDYVSLKDRFDHGAEFRPTAMTGQIPCHLTFNSRSEVVNCVIENEAKEPDAKLPQGEGFGDSGALHTQEVVCRPEMDSGDVLQPSRDVVSHGNQTSRFFSFENRNEAFGLLGYHKKYTFFPAFVIFLKVINEYYWQAK